MANTTLDSRGLKGTHDTPCRRCSPQSAVPHYNSNGACRRCTYERAQAQRKKRTADTKALRSRIAELETRLKAMTEHRDALLVNLTFNTPPGAQPDLIGE